MPQLLGSLAVVTQAAPHAVWPALQPTHFPPMQAAPDAHCGFVVQLIVHAVAPQMKGAQVVVDTGGQLPAPSQLAAAVARLVAIAQLAVRQEVLDPGKLQVDAVPMHVPTHTPLPAQAACPVFGAPDTKVHVPGVALQTSQDPVQARSQQKPSAQVVPATQPPAVVWQVWPRLLLHVPVASHVPGHAARSVSSRLTIGRQRPRVAVSAQLKQGPAQVLSQQTPSMQLPFVHSVPVPHVTPLAFFGWQTPVASQKVPAAQGWDALHMSRQRTASRHCRA